MHYLMINGKKYFFIVQLYFSISNLLKKNAKVP